MDVWQGRTSSPLNEVTCGNEISYKELLALELKTSHFWGRESRYYLSVSSPTCVTKEIAMKSKENGKNGEESQFIINESRNSRRSTQTKANPSE